MEKSVDNLNRGASGTIVKLLGGVFFQRRLRTMGIREGKIFKVLAIQPFGGPVVVEVEGRAVTIGRGMAHRIIVNADKSSNLKNNSES